MKKLGVAFAFLAAGCWSYDEVKWKDVPLNAANVEKIKGGIAEVTLQNGRLVVLSGARAYGDAFCDRYACVRRGEITGIVSGKPERQTQTADPALLLVAPLALPWLLLWAGQANYEAQRQGVTYTPPTFTHPAVAADRHWLATGYLTVAEASKHQTVGNPCAEHLPAHVTTDAQALGWVYANRKPMTDVECLASATTAMTGTDPASLEQRLRMTMLLRARSAWISDQCRRADMVTRLTPMKEFDGAPASQFAVVSEILADDTTYLLPEGDLTPLCSSAGLEAPEAIVSREIFAAAMEPFSARGIWTRVDNRSRYNTTP